MSQLHSDLRRSTLPLLLVICLAALSFSYAFAEDAARPLAVTVIGDPDAAVAGKFAVGSASVGSKALTVTGVIDFLGAGTVHNYFTQGAGNNMQINTNVDEANTVGDATRSQWKVVLGSNLDWFSIRRSPAGGTYNEDALFFIDGSTGRVGIATVDTANGAAIPFTPIARLHVETASGDAVRGETSAPSFAGVFGYSSATTGFNYGVWGQSASTSGAGVLGLTLATTGFNSGVYGASSSTSGYGVYGQAYASTGTNYGVFGLTSSPSGYGVYYEGGLAGTGTKSAIVETDDYGWRALYAMESPQNWFEDFGQATLVAGEAVVSIEPIFAQTVNLDETYHVFLTPRGDCGLYVAEQTAASFTVRGLNGATCDIAFDYRIIAPRLDYEDLRLKPAQDPEAVAASLAPTPPEIPTP